MKITIGRLKTIIQEELDEYKKKMSSSYKRDEDEESPKEELGDDAHAESAEQTDIIVGDLKKVLEKWEEAEYESDESRWQEYAKDIQGLVDQFEGKEEHDCEDHPDMSHEEWEAKQGEEREETEEEAEEEAEDKEEDEEKSESKPKKSKKSSGSGKKNFPYESKELEEKVYQQLLKALS